MTYWMLQQAKIHLVKKYDYCFIYGGANDMYSVGIKPQTAVDNIKYIARICKEKGIICVVLTGFDAKTCTRSNNLEYPTRYTEFQKLLMSQDMEGAVVVDTRVVARTDCWDYLCHMAPSGHKKIAEKIVKDLALQRI
jgi:lysophospholipase L1-like esterase